MKILYIVERPIQNDLPFLLFNSSDNINVIVLCISKSGGALIGNENINQSVFNNKYLYEFPYQFIDSATSLLSYIKQADVIVIFGHFHFLFRKAILLTKLLNKKLVLTSDATSIQGIAGSKGWKLTIKPFLFKLLYNQIADALFVPSTASENFFKDIGIMPKKIVLTPYTVNEQFLQSCLNHCDTIQLKESLGINLNNTVFLFCGKLIQRKRAKDILLAFASLKISNATIIIVGNGPLISSLQILAKDLGISHQVIFTGLVPYDQLVCYYLISTVLVVPADHEPYGLPINEAMILGTPVIASNAVGAAGDLIVEGVTGFTYQVRDIQSLSKKMKLFIDSPQLKNALSANCKLRMQSWSSQSNVDAQLKFFKLKGWLI